MNLCFACEYAWRISKKCDHVMCHYCPLKSLWGEDCLGVESPYRLWDRSIDRVKNAKIIADAARKELEKLK